MPSGSVQVLNVAQVSLPPLPETPPPVKLSFFDCIWIGYQHVKRILLYSNPNTNISFPSLVQILKSSLSETLLDFLPLAGNLTYVKSTGDVEIDFSNPNVVFVEAESDLDLRQLASSETHDVDSFLKLAPMVDAVELPFPIFAVQVTRFACGGVAIGYSSHHAVADGKALWEFVEAWSSACRAKARGEVPIERCNPCYDRTMIVHPRGEGIAREFLRTGAPFLPKTGVPSAASIANNQNHLTRRTFILNAPSIQALKLKASHLENGHTTSKVPSTFVALAAHAWICFATSKPFAPNIPTFLAFLMDCRSRLDPPVQDNYFGNCVRLICVRMSAGELTGRNGFSKACFDIRRKIHERSKEPLSDCENWVAELEELKKCESVCVVSASPKFRVYEMDFGWGKPDRVELVSMNKDGEVALVGGKDEGTVQVSVSLDSTQMDTFADHLLMV